MRKKGQQKTILRGVFKIFTIFAANLKVILTSYKNGISYRTRHDGRCASAH